MKHVKLGLSLLAALLAIGLLLTGCLSGLRTQLCGTLDAAASQALAGDWVSANHAADTGRQLWEEHHKFVAAVVDHELLEEADTLFAQLEVYRTLKLTAEYAAVCKCLVRQMEAIGESQSLRWWHLL